MIHLELKSKREGYNFFAWIDYNGEQIDCHTHSSENFLLNDWGFLNENTIEESKHFNHSKDITAKLKSNDWKLIYKHSDGKLRTLIPINNPMLTPEEIKEDIEEEPLWKKFHKAFIVGQIYTADKVLYKWVKSAQSEAIKQVLEELLEEGDIEPKYITTSTSGSQEDFQRMGYRQALSDFAEIIRNKMKK